MANAKFSQGLYEVRFNDKGEPLVATGIFILAGPIYGTIGAREDEVEKRLANKAERTANAHLFAAAPDLYVALKAMLTRECGCYCNQDPNWHSDKCFVDIAKKAIAKAEGGAQ